MANDFSQNPFFFDTAGTDLYAGRVNIRTISGRNTTGLTTTMRMQDSRGNDIYNKEVPANSQIDLTVDGWVDGIELAGLAADTFFYVYIN